MKFLKYYWMNSKVALAFAFIICPIMSLIASLHDGHPVPDFLLLGAGLVLVTVIGDFIVYRKR